MEGCGTPSGVELLRASAGWSRALWWLRKNEMRTTHHAQLLVMGARGETTYSPDIRSFAEL
jgi:hypothetical protein